MRAIVIGCDGTVGSALFQTLMQRGDVVFGTTRRPQIQNKNLIFLDLATEVDNIHMPPADIAFFCAAVTSFSACRANPMVARQVNVKVPALLARRFVNAGTRVVLLSTSGVFDWRTPNVPADREPCPVSKYGEFAAEAEAAFMALGPLASILRLTKLLAPDAKLFTGWIDKLSLGKEIVAYSDIHISPLAIEDAMFALVTIANDPAGGIYQISGAGDISYYEAARYLALRLRRDESLIMQRRAVDVGIPEEEVPHFASLDASRITKLTGWNPPQPYEVIGRVYGSLLERAYT